MAAENPFAGEISERFVHYEKVLNILERNNIPHGVIGGFGQYFYGRGRYPSRDMDIGIAPQDVGHTLNVIRHTQEFRIEEKHPGWLNQVWSQGEPSHSIDLVHRHSTGLVEVKPWWFEMGVSGEISHFKANYAAPEGIALLKVLLFSRRNYDLPDAVQTVQGASERFRPFDWELFTNELGWDWRLAYALAVQTETLYGRESDIAIGNNIKEKFHSSFTDDPIPGPVRGHYFAYDAFPGAGDENTWRETSGNVYAAKDNSVDAVLNEIDKWHTDNKALVNASRIAVSDGWNFDWNELTDRLGENWRMGLSLMLYAEVLYGETGSRAILPEIRRELSERFVESTPDVALGKQLFPDRF